MSQSGSKEHAEGEAEYKAAQAKKYVGGVSERVGGEHLRIVFMSTRCLTVAIGYKDSVVGAVVGDSSQQAAGERSGVFL